jgi:predicted peptidase
MNRNSYFPLLLGLFISGCLTSNSAISQPFRKIYFVTSDSLHLFDTARYRSVPVALYLPKTNNSIPNQKVVIFSHGYNENKPGSSKAYSFITENLASYGYFVASIQHELPTDSLLPLTGIPQIVRRTNWERGVQNILFVMNELKKRYPALDYKQLILMGHSNGGDMTMLFAREYPYLVDKVISLDNRRVAFPRTNQAKIYSIRSSDQVADENVLPTLEEQEKYGIKIVKLSHTLHNDMGNNANVEQRNEINHYIVSFLNDHL